MHQAEITHYCYFDSPIGNLLIAGNLKALGLIAFPNQTGVHEIQKIWIHSIPPFRSVIDQLSAYFKGNLKEFSLECLLTGSEFQVNTETSGDQWDPSLTELSNGTMTEI